MKKSIIVFLAFLSMSCSDSGLDLLGDWSVDSKHYQSTCRIQEEEGKLQGLILSYDDGTTRFHHKDGAQRYLFEDLKKKKDIYVDGISGATIKKDTPPTLSIAQKSRDTLLVTTQILNRPSTEVWTRKR